MQYIKEIDIHGYTQQEARKMIDAALKKPDALTLRSSMDIIKDRL